MPDTERSIRLDMPYLLPAQAQKHVTHNEALQILDAVVQLSVASFDAQIPPADAPEGQIHALGSSPTGVWEGRAGQLASRVTAGWNFIPPQPGWRAHDLQTGGLRIFRAGSWQALLHNVDGIGVGTVPDATNRLAVAAPATLLSHAGDSHRVIVNKATGPDTASLLFQSGWSGRAEMGLTGTEDFTIRASADGATFTTALQVDRATGRVVLPAGAEMAGPLTGTAVTAHVTDATLSRVTRVGDFGIGINGDNQPASLRIADASVDLPAGLFSGPGSTGMNYPNSTARFYPFLNALRRVGADSFTQARLYLAGVSNVTIGVKDTGGAWTHARLYSEANVLGTVSQIAGAPTGAVIERGSNANGEYVRFADGTQICTRIVDLDGLSIDIAHGSVFRSTTFSYTFPAAFQSVQFADAVLGGSDTTNIHTGAIGAKLRYGSSSKTVDWQNIVFFAAFAAPGTAGHMTRLGLSAIGRWF